MNNLNNHLLSAPLTYCNSNVYAIFSYQQITLLFLFSYFSHSFFFVFQELRNRFIFKIVPMLNPDGVIVGNYRCSLAARDLNRNYRHPRKESFPTVWHTKTLIEKIQERHEVSILRLETPHIF